MPKKHDFSSLKFIWYTVISGLVKACALELSKTTHYVLENNAICVSYEPWVECERFGIALLCGVVSVSCPKIIFAVVFGQGFAFLETETINCKEIRNQIRSKNKFVYSFRSAAVSVNEFHCFSCDELLHGTLL